MPGQTIDIHWLFVCDGTWGWMACGVHSLGTNDNGLCEKYGIIFKLVKMILALYDLKCVNAPLNKPIYNVIIMSKSFF